MALKHVKDKSLHDQMIEEGKLLSKHNHNNVVRMWGLTELRGSLWIVMEYVPNGSLDNVVCERMDELGTVQFLQMAIDISAGFCLGGGLTVDL